MVIVVERSGKAGRHCEIVRWLAGFLTLIYEPWIAEQTLQATAVKRLGWQVGCQRPAVPELGR